MQEEDSSIQEQKPEQKSVTNKKTNFEAKKSLQILDSKKEENLIAGLLGYFPFSFLFLLLLNYPSSSSELAFQEVLFLSLIGKSKYFTKKGR